MIKISVCGFATILCLLIVSCQPTTGKNISYIGNSAEVDYFIIKATNGAKFISFQAMEELFNNDSKALTVDYEDSTGFVYNETNVPIWISDTEIHQIIQWKASKYTISIPDEYFYGVGSSYTTKASSSLQHTITAPTDVNKFAITLNNGKFVDSASKYDTYIYVSKHPFLFIPVKLMIESDSTATAIIDDEYSVESLSDEVTITIPKPVVENSTGFTAVASKVL